MSLQKIQQQCLEGRLSISEAVNLIDNAIGGITRVEYNEGLRFKIYNHRGIFSLEARGFSRKQVPRLHALAVLSYYKAEENESDFLGGVHISREVSTKHHMNGIYEIAERYGGLNAL